jgi:hypothetical protein
MDFKVLRLTANGNLLLEKCDRLDFKSEQDAAKRNAIERLPLYFKGTKIATIYEPIGSITNPFYLASVDAEDGKKFVGLTLSSDANKR